jgi:hypothetical protein
MGVCILGMGDCGSKSDTKSVTNVEKINQTMTNMVSSKSQNVQATQINTQNMKVTVTRVPGYTGINIKNCVFKNNQEMNATQNVSVTLDLSSTANLQTQISNALQAANNTATTQKTAFLQTASTTANNYTTTNEAIKNLVSTNISDSLTQSLQQLMNNAQNNEVFLEGPVECAPGTSLVENVQKMLVTQISNTLTKALTGTTAGNAATSSSGVTTTSNTDQKGGGIGEFISSVFSGLTGLMTGPFLIIGLIVVVMGILFFVFRGTISKIAEKKLGFGRRKGRVGRRSTRGRRY